jgi:hypothetical protein
MIPLSENDTRGRGMREKLAKNLRAVFEERLRACFPQLRSEKPRLAPPGSRCYSIPAGPGLAWFVQLVVSEDLDEFAVEIAWSRTGEYPSTRVRGLPRGAVPLGAEVFLDLAEVWLGDPPPAEPDQGPLSIDLWWHLGAGESQTPPERLEALVDHAITVLVRHGVPHLRRAAEQGGLSVHLVPLGVPPSVEVDPGLLPKMTRAKRARRTPRESDAMMKALEESVGRLVRHHEALRAKPKRGKGHRPPSSV